MCCVMPPASRDVTFVERIASRRLVFPWSTWPSTVTTGGRSFSFAGSTSSQRISLPPIASGVSASSSATGTASSSGRVSMPSSFATSDAVSKSTVSLIETIKPMFTSPRITSTTLASSARARSPTWIVLGSVTTEVVGSATATAGAASGIGCGARCGRRPLGRGPRCGRLRPALASEERAVLLIQVLLVRSRGLRLDLRDEVMADGLLDDLARRHGLGDRDRLGLGLRLELGTDLGLAADIDPPAGELRGQAGVLALLADRKRELPVRDDDIRGLVLGHDVDPDDVRRLEGRRDETPGALRPLDDVDLLATQLVHDRLNAQATLADARPARVEPGLARADGDLRAAPRLARDADDLHLSVEDLRDLELEEPLHEGSVGPAHDDLRAPQRPAHLEDDDLARLTGEVALVGGLLRARQDRGRTAVELHDRGARLEVADLRVDDVALAVRVLGEHLLALGLPQRLLDDLLRGLRADPSERGRRLFEGDDLAELRVGLDLLGGVELDLDLRILDLLDHRLQEVDLERARLDVDLDVDVLLIAVSALDRPGDDVADDLLGEALLGGELRETGDELSVHGALPLFFFSLSPRPSVRLPVGRKKSGVDPLSVPDAASGSAGRQQQLYQTGERRPRERAGRRAAPT